MTTLTIPYFSYIDPINCNSKYYGFIQIALPGLVALAINKISHHIFCSKNDHNSKSIKRIATYVGIALSLYLSPKVSLALPATSAKLANVFDIFLQYFAIELSLVFFTHKVVLLLGGISTSYLGGHI